MVGPLQEQMQQRLDALAGALATIRRRMEALVAENQRMREVVRLAEAELRKRRDQVQRLEAELAGLNHSRAETKARIENAMEKIESLIAASNEG